MEKNDYSYLTGLDADFKHLNELVSNAEWLYKSGQFKKIKELITQYYSKTGIPIINKLWNRSLEWYDHTDRRIETLFDQELWVAINKDKKQQYLNYADTIFGNQFKHIKMVVPERLKRFTQFYHDSWIEFLNLDESKDEVNVIQFLAVLQFILISTYQSLEEQLTKSLENYKPRLSPYITKYDSDYIKPITLQFGNNNRKVLEEVYDRLIKGSKIYLSFDEFLKHFKDGEHPTRITWSGTTKELVTLFDGVVFPSDPIPLKSLRTSNETILLIHEHFNNNLGGRIPLETIKTTIKRGEYYEEDSSDVVVGILKRIYQFDIR